MLIIIIISFVQLVGYYRQGLYLILKRSNISVFILYLGPTHKEQPLDLCGGGVSPARLGWQVSRVRWLETIAKLCTTLDVKIASFAIHKDMPGYSTGLSAHSEWLILFLGAYSFGNKRPLFIRGRVKVVFWRIVLRCETWTMWCICWRIYYYRYCILHYLFTYLRWCCRY